jgi:hypothetical protein
MFKPDPKLIAASALVMLALGVRALWNARSSPRQ